ncbi:hypothetical protein Tco_1200903 [Tanacetum coccineum]
MQTRFLLRSFKKKREKFTIEQKAKFLHDTIATQRRFLAQQRSEAIRNKFSTRNQLRNQMMTYLKYVGRYKHAQLNKKKFEEIQVMYEKLKLKNLRRISGRRLKMKAPKRSKRQKIDSDHEEENQLRTFLKIVPEEEEKINYEVLGTRVFRADEYMKRFEQHLLKGKLILLLWGDLRIMFESKEDDELWKNQEEWKLQSWILYENCRVHVLRLEDGVEINMLAERRYPFTKNTLERMIDLRLTVVSDDDTVFDLLRFIEQQIDEFGGQDGNEEDL